MKVFLSWSGEHAKKLTGLLMDWLPNVIQTVEPWTSEEIGKGTRWSDEIARELDESRFGILCLDRDHLESPWIHFEAGAIAKSLPGATARNRVTPLLLGIDEVDLRDPLALFQATKLEREDMFRLVRSLNDVQDAPLDTIRLTKAFDQWWPALASNIEELKATTSTTKASTKLPGSEAGPGSSDLLEEVLHLLREQRRAIARLEQEAPSPRSRVRSMNPAPVENRINEVIAILEKLDLDVASANFHGEDRMTLILTTTPSRDALSELHDWAVAKGWTVTLRAPGAVQHEVGIRIASD